MLGLLIFAVQFLADTVTRNNHFDQKNESDAIMPRTMLTDS
jgi:hypothetical protein